MFKMIICIAFALATQSIYANQTDPLPILVQYPFALQHQNTEIAWSPDNTRIAFSNVQPSKDSYESWVTVAGILPNGLILPIQKIEHVATAYWLDATKLAVLDGYTYTIWSIPPSGSPTQEPIRSPKTATEQEREQAIQAANKQCTKRVDGLSVIDENSPTTQALKWSEPYEDHTLSLGEMVEAEFPQRPCLSGDGKLVAFVTKKNDKEQLVIASLTERSVPASKPAPAAWGIWTERQILNAIFAKGLPNLANIKLQIFPWPGQPNTAAALVYGNFYPNELENSLAVIEASTGRLRVVAQTSLDIRNGNTFSVTQEPSPITFHKTENILLVRNIYDAVGNTGYEGGERQIYVRWDGSTLNEILSFSPKYYSEQCSGSDINTSTIKTLKTTTQGYHDILITTESSVTSRAADDNETTIDKTQQHWRWNGSKYELVK